MVTCDERCTRSQRGVGRGGLKTFGERRTRGQRGGAGRGRAGRGRVITFGTRRARSQRGGGVGWGNNVR